MQDVAEKLMKLSDALRELAESLQTAEESTPVKFEEPELSMEEVRGILADKSRAGHTDEIREILKKYGADRLSAADPKDYFAIAKEAEELKDD